MDKRSSQGNDFIPLAKKYCSDNPPHQSPTIPNSQLITRVKKLLSDDSIVLEDNEDMVKYLQDKFPDYRKKKKSTLRFQIQSAINQINSEEYPVTKGKPRKSLNSSISDMYSMNNKQVDVQTPAPTTPKLKVKKTDNEQTVRKFELKPKISFSDLGGIEPVVEQILEMVYHLQHPEKFSRLGISPPKGFLIQGPHGTGKTCIVEAIANEINVPLFGCASTELVSGVSGETEAKIRDLFAVAKANQPCILFIDEIDTICPRRDQSSREMEKRMASQLMMCLDSIEPNGQVVVIGVTNRPDALDPALRTRLEEEIALGMPDSDARHSILGILTRGVKMSPKIDLKSIARNSPGFVGSDLKYLVRRAAYICLKRGDQQGQTGNSKMEVEGDSGDQLQLEEEDFAEALQQVQPSAKREGFATVPNVSWNDIGALSEAREELQLSILAPLKYPEDVATLEMQTSVGILLCGPPGCGKTLLAKAIANESELNFISVKGPELLNMYVGESERAVRAAFRRAKNFKPCVLFFDEIDALCRKRSDDATGSAVSSSVVNQLLTEMDGLESRSCILLAATNRPDILDPAILRPGRFDQVVYVGLPQQSERYEILRAITKNGIHPPCDSSVDLVKISSDPRTEGFTGADLQSLVNQAKKSALKDRVFGRINPEQSMKLSASHFEDAFNTVKPSVSRAEMAKYERMKEKYSRNK